MEWLKGKEERPEYHGLWKQYWLPGRGQELHPSRMGTDGAWGASGATGYCAEWEKG
jgi:hypothetical protein